HREQSPPLRIHGRLPQLRSRHLTQTFIALHVVAAAAFFFHVLEQLTRRSLLDRLNRGPVLGRGLGSFLIGLSVRLRGFVISSFVNLLGCGARLGRSFHHERRLQIRLNLLELRNQLPALGARSQLPADHVLRTLRVHDLHFPQIVFF